MHMAAQRGRLEFARMLLANGADPMLADDRGAVPHQFAEAPDLRELLGGPSDKLHAAVRKGTVQEVATLCATHPELVASEDGKGDTPLLVALELQKMDMVEYFCRHPAAIGFIDDIGAKGEPPLYVASRLELDKIVKLLLKAGADPNLKSLRMNRYTSGSYDVVDKDTGEKSSVSAEHRTPIFEAAELGNVAIAKMLLAGGADPDARDGDGCTPLFTAMDEDELEVADLLLKYGADPDIGNKDIGDENTLLAWASSRRVLDHVELLLAHGADPNASGKSGMFPLHMAARSGGAADHQGSAEGGSGCQPGRAVGARSPADCGKEPALGQGRVRGAAARSGRE